MHSSFFCTPSTRSKNFSTLKLEKKKLSFDLSSTSPRRSSTTSSISIKVETCTTSSSLPTYDIHERRIPPMISTTIEPSPPPAVHLSTPSSNSSYSCSMINVPPPAYQFPPPSSTTITTDLNPLSFYSFPPPSSSSSSSSTPSQTLPFSILTRISIDNNASPPPEYSQVPQTFSERCFVFGFLCPLIWLIGFSKYFYSETNHSSDRFSSTFIKDLEAGVGSLEENELERILESLESWREEEKLWSLRCGSCFGGFLSLGLLAGIVIAAVIGKL